MLGIVRFAADLPEVGIEGLLASSEILLCRESLLVGSNRGEVTSTIVDCCAYDCETSTCIDLIGAHIGRTFGLLTEVQTVTLIAFGGCYAVRSCSVY